MNKEANTYYCIVTGEPKYIPPSLVKNKLKKFGDESLFREHYVSTPARKLLKSGMTVKEVREQLGATDDVSDISPQILLRLKLMKLTSRKGRKEAEEHAERERYLKSQEFRDKRRAWKDRQKNMTFKDWVETYTGTGYHRGGTCIRPDIFLTHNNRACDGCECYEFCMCYNKRLSHEKRKPKKR